MTQYLDAAAFSAASAAVGAVLGALTKYLLDRRKQSDQSENERLELEAKLEADARQQTHDQLIRHVGRLEARIDQLEKAHSACQRENAELHEKVGKLTEAVARLEADIKDYEAGDA